MFTLTLVTPEKTIVKKEELLEITLPAQMGELNILPGHAPLVTVLKAGKLGYKLASGLQNDFVMAWGYCQVTDDGVLVLAESLKNKEELQVSFISSQIKNLEEKLNTETLDEESYEKIIKSLDEMRAQSQFLN